MENNIDLTLFYDNPGINVNDLLEDDDEFAPIIQQEIALMNNTLKNFTKQILEVQGVYSNTTYDFIGAHPISLSRMDDWLVCEKTDGVRYIMIILSNGHVYLTGRNVGGLQQLVKEYQYFLINMKLPQILYNSNEKICIEQIFDGEIIVDEFKDSLNQNIHRMHYLIFDTLWHNSEQKVYQNINGNMMPISYFDRLRCGEEYIDLIRTSKLLNKNKIQPELQQLKYLPKIKPILKDFFQISQLKYLLKHYITTLPHYNDGLIFTQNKAFYKPGTCKFIQKWKPPHKNSIDFLITPNKKIELCNLFFHHSDSYLYLAEENDGMLELYLMSKIKDEQFLMFFDFIYTKKEVVREIEQKINEIYESQQNNVQAIKGVVAECCLVSLNQQQQQMKKLMQPQMFGVSSDQIELFFTEILKNTQNFLKSSFAIQEFKNDQLQLLKSVREMIHLKYNFKSTWKIEKYRKDKTYPNHYRVGLNILEILNENLTQNDLIELSEQKSNN